MHELSLYSSIPHARHAQVLNILAGLSAMQPQEVYTRNIVVAPIRAASDPNLINKKNQQKTNAAQQQLSYVQLIQDLPRDAFGGGNHNGAEAIDATQNQWQSRIQDVPEPEIKNLVLRRVTEEPAGEVEMAKYFDITKNRFVNEYITEGHRFVHQDIILTLYRVLYFKTDPGKSGPSAQLPPLDDLLLLDSSGALVLEATVRVEDRSKPALVQAATEQLMGLRNDLKGAVELRVPERLSMDTRVRG